MEQVLALGLIGPVLALIGWTFVMAVWLYATRIPAISKAKIDFEAVRQGEKLQLPAKVTRVADNYNHLHEQPTIFYALALAAQFLDSTDMAAISLAWAYVAIRIIHSLVQATINIIPIRFSIFLVATLTLLALFVRVTMAALAQVGC